MKIRKPKIKLGSKTSWILCGLSAIGVVATGVTAVKATPRAVDKIRSDSRKNHDGDPYAYTKKEAVASAWKYYILPTSVGVATIVCIFGTNALNRRQQAAIISAYTAVSQSFNAYKSKVKDIYGQEGHNKVVDEIMKDVEKAEPRNIITPFFLNTSTLDFNNESDEVPHLFYESYTNRYFESTISNVLKAEYHLNRNYMIGGAVTLNDYLDFLGIERTEGGDNVGWDGCDGLMWIDFDHHTTHLDDGLEVYVIDLEWPPTMLG